MSSGSPLRRLIVLVLLITALAVLLLALQIRQPPPLPPLGEHRLPIPFSGHADRLSVL